MENDIIDNKLKKAIEEGCINDSRIENLKENYTVGMLPIVIMLKNKLDAKDRELLKKNKFEEYYEHKLINCVSGWIKCENIVNLEAIENIDKIYLSYISPENKPLDFKKKDILKLVSKGIRKKSISKVKKINNYLIPDYSEYGWQNQSKRVTRDTGSEELWKTGLTGKNVKIGVVDTGINDEHLDVKYQSWLHYEDTDFKKKIIKVKSFVENDKDIMDKSGHGTGIAGLICGNGKGSSKAGSEGRFPGMAPEAELIVAKAFTYEGQEVLSMTIMAAIEWTILEGADIVCMFHDNDNRPYSLNHEDNDRPLSQLIKVAATKRNIIFSFAGGNDGPFYNSILYPATNSYGITAGSTCQRQDYISEETESGFQKLGPEKSTFFTGVVPFSARGADESRSLKPDLVVPGANIVLPFNNRGMQSRRMKMGHPLKLMNDEFYLAASGTSVSAGALAGTLAQVLGYCKKKLNDEFTYYRFKSFILNNCRNDIGEAKWTKAVEVIPLEDTPKDIHCKSELSEHGFGQIDVNKAKIAIDNGVCIYFDKDVSEAYQCSWKFSINEEDSATKDLVIYNAFEKNINIKLYIQDEKYVEKFLFPDTLEGKNKEFKVPIKLIDIEKIEFGSHKLELAVVVSEGDNVILKSYIPILFKKSYILDEKIVLEKKIWSKGNSILANGVFKSDWMVDEILTKDRGMKVEVESRSEFKADVMVYDDKYNLVKPYSEEGNVKLYRNLTYKVYLASFIVESDIVMKEHRCKININKLGGN